MITLPLVAAFSATLLSAGPAPQVRNPPPTPQPDARPPPPPVTPASARPAGTWLRRSIVTVRATTQDWDFKAPWSKTGPRARSFSGLIVDGKAILVTAGGLGNLTA